MSGGRGTGSRRLCLRKSPDGLPAAPGAAFVFQKAFKKLPLLSGWVYLAAGADIVVAAVQTGLAKRVWKRMERLLVRRMGEKAPDLPSILSDFRHSTGIGMGLAHLVLILAIRLLRGAVLFVLALCLGLNVSFWLMLACRSMVVLVDIVPISIIGLGNREALLLLILPL